MANNQMLLIAVPFSTGLEMEQNLNRAISDLGEALKKKGLIPMNLEAANFDDNMKPIYKVEIGENLLYAAAPAMLEALKSLQKRLHNFAHEGELSEQDKEIVFDMHLSALAAIQSAEGSK